MEITGMKVTLTELLELASEALQRTGYYNFEEGHPEDLVAALVPTLEAIAVGYSEGYRRGRADMKQIMLDSAGRERWVSDAHEDE